MHIGFDAKRLFHNSTGLGYYSRTLIHNILQQKKDCKISLFDARPRSTGLTHAFYQNLQVNIVTTSKPSWFSRSIDPGVGFKNSGINIYHGLSNELPITKKNHLPYVVTIHDLLYKYFSMDFPFVDRLLYHVKTKNALAKADKVIAISHATKQDIIKTFNTSEDNIEVIYQSYDPDFLIPLKENELQEVMTKYRLPAEYNYYVGSLTHRKNANIILEAMYTQSENNRIPLVMVGNGQGYLKVLKDTIVRKRLSKYVYILPGLQRAEIKALYHGANTVIYPSLGEGFGLPVLEAIATNTPIITSNLSSMPEAGGDVALYFDPQNAEELSHLMQSINKKEWQLNIKEKRVQHLEIFSAESIISQLFNKVYRPILK
jgi:glycosyltransferase involved in cell wall biosynthesis